jgi:hypothetical protein
MVRENGDLKADDSEQEGESADDGGSEAEDDTEKEKPAQAEVVGVYDNRPEGYEESCLRPLGFCDLGGCCDICWYRPDNPYRKTN